MNTYTYSYRSDSNKEIIGRVQAADLFEAQIKVATIKQLGLLLFAFLKALRAFLSAIWVTVHVLIIHASASLIFSVNRNPFCKKTLEIL